MENKQVIYCMYENGVSVSVFVHMCYHRLATHVYENNWRADASFQRLFLKTMCLEMKTTATGSQLTVLNVHRHVGNRC